MTSKCDEWHRNQLVNPFTNRNIKRYGPKYKELLRKCGSPPRRSPQFSTTISPTPSRSYTKSPTRSSSYTSYRSSQKDSSSDDTTDDDSSVSSYGTARSTISTRVIRRAPRKIYCGNNAFDEGLVNKTKILGSRYQCLRKGVGKGLHEPILHYNEDYKPIDNIKLYCGINDVLPPYTDRFGTREECLRKGFAIGQQQKYMKEGIQRTPVVSEEKGWYKVLLPVKK